MSLKSKNSTSTVRRPPKMLTKQSDSKFIEQTLHGTFYIYSKKKLQDISKILSQKNTTSSIIYSDMAFKLSHYGYYYFYTFIEISDPSVYTFEVNKGTLHLYHGKEYKIGKHIESGSTCKVTLEIGLYLIHVECKHDGNEDLEDLVTYSSTPDIKIQYSSIGIAWPLTIKAIEKQIIPKEKCMLPIIDLFTPSKTDNLYLNVDTYSQSSFSSKSPSKRPIAPNKVSRTASDPNEMRDIMEYKDHLERQIDYYSSVFKTHVDDKAYNFNA